MRKKNLGMRWVMLCIGLLFMGSGLHLQAAAGKTSVAVSAGTVNIGDTLKVTARAAGPSGEKTVATMTVSYDSAVFSFVDCSATYGGGGGSVTATSDSFTVTLKAISAGSSKISVAGSDGVIFDTNEELDSVEGSSTTVAVNNAASGADPETAGGAGGSQADVPAPGENKTDTSGENAPGAGGAPDETAKNLSADNSLKTLSISPGTLSPEFTGKTVQYAATVANDVTSVAVTATPANEKAIVESVTGNENLAVGKNALKIVVKAENGVTATYTITVTRQEAEASPEKSEEAEKLPKEPEEPEEPEGPAEERVAIGEKSYRISEAILPEEIPAGCSEAAVSYHGKDYKGVHFDKGGLSMLLLADESGEAADASYFIYNGSEDAFYPFVQLMHGDGFIIWKPVPADYAAGENERQMDITVNDGETMSVRQREGEEPSDFSFFYAVNQDGTEGWYEYDALEKTYQRQHGMSAASPQTEEAAREEGAEEALALEYMEEEYSRLESELKKEKSFSRTAIGILAFIAVVLLVLIINLILFKKGSSEEFDSYEEKDVRHQKKAQPVKRAAPEARDAAPSGKSRHKEETPDAARENADGRKEAALKLQKTAGQKRGGEEALKPQKTAGQKRGAAETEEKGKKDIEVIDFNDL